MLDFFNKLYINEYYMIQLLAAQALFAFKLPRRKRFALRTALCAAACLVVSYFVIDNIHNIAGVIPAALQPYTIIFLSLFLMTVIAMIVCFAGSVWNILYCAVAAYATQNTANCIEQIFLTATGTLETWKNRLIMILIFGAVYTAMYFLFARKLHQGDCVNIDNKSVIMLALIVVLVCLVFNTFAMSRDLTPELRIVFRITLALCCFLTLSFQFGLLSRGRLQQEKEMIERLFNEKKEQYEISKENIELINIKCHDLKHQIRTIRSSEGEIDREALKEIEKAVNIYDSVVKTGNDTLDVILTEKSLLCEKEGLTLEIIADGEQLSFMSKIDIYSLFGNALENAVEAAKKLENRQMRVIGLKVAGYDGLLSIHLQNYYKDGIVMENGLPLTTKDDNKYHGFGLKSIRLIASKYNGSVSVSATDKIFNLNIIIPIP